MFVLYIIIAILVLLLMVTVHEFGHYTAGKLFKFKINEFSIGFGTKLYQKKKKNGELFSIRLFPLGGYCAFEGETIESKDKNVKSFVDEKPWKRIIVLLAGVVFNFVSAIVLSFLYIIVVGYQTPVIKEINAQIPAISKLHVGDEIVSINGKSISAINTYSLLLSDVSENDSIDLGIKREKETFNTSLSLVKLHNSNGEEYLGFEGLTFEARNHNAGMFKALLQSIPLTLKFSVMIITAFIQLFSGKVALDQLTGPIGTISSIATIMTMSFKNLFVLMPMIAANLAIFNLIPLPALDGSRIIFTAIEWIRGKPIKREIENVIHLVGFFVLIGFVILMDFMHFV